MKPLLQVQLLNDELPRPEKECGGQAEQALSDVAPAAVPYLPAPQALQASAPATGLNLPAWQLTHCPPSGPDAPGLHLHWVIDELPDGDDDDAGQVEQPADVANFPASQGPVACTVQAAASTASTNTCLCHANFMRG